MVAGRRSFTTVAAVALASGGLPTAAPAAHADVSYDAVVAASVAHAKASGGATVRCMAVTGSRVEVFRYAADVTSFALDVPGTDSPSPTPRHAQR
jgi:hypothetical protein